MNTSVSVLMPARNAERTINIAIRSTLSALDSNDQLIVYDDASRDSTPSILRRIGNSDSRLRIVLGEAQAGVAAGLNRLLDEADHPLIARMDADDICPPWRFSAQRAATLKSGGITFGTRINFGRSLRAWTPARPIGLRDAAVRVALLVENPLPHSSMMGATSTIRELGGYRQSMSEDYDLWLRAVDAGQPAQRLATPLVFYRRHVAQVTASADWAERAAKDGPLIDSHLRHSRAMGWAGSSVWPTLCRPPSPSDDALAGSFYEFARDCARSLRGIEQIEVTRMIDRASMAFSRGEAT